MHAGKVRITGGCLRSNPDGEASSAGSTVKEQHLGAFTRGFESHGGSFVAIGAKSRRFTVPVNMVAETVSVKLPRPDSVALDLRCRQSHKHKRDRVADLASAGSPDYGGMFTE